MNPIPANYQLALPASDLVEKREIARKLAELLISGIPPSIGMLDKNGDWTRSVRSLLRTLLSGSDFVEPQWMCFPEGPETAKGEFLVDFLWWRAREGAALVVESEWSTKWEHILDDFGKIAVFKAPFKLMIYNTGQKEPTSSFLKEKFEDHLSNYAQHIQGETYIFLEFMANERAQAFVWQAKASGVDKAAILEPLLPVTPVSRRLASR